MTANPSPRRPPDAASGRRFGAFEGVFTPTLLTILGVIMYLREGWVVGQVGLLGAWAVILLASGITICTALSLSSIATNVPLGAGGPFAILTRSLGVELGGSIGIPLFLSQAFAVSMYLFGLREGWCWVFPGHPAWLVDGVAYVVVMALAAVSASLAFRVQYLVMIVIAVSLVAVIATLFTGQPFHSPEFLPPANDSIVRQPFWAVFAVYFPAVTGIMAGANMSGELKNPRRSIPLGTLTAVGLATVIYVVLAYWLACAATPEDLRDNYTVMIDRSALAPAMIAGLLGATFSSALSSTVGAPRILHALAEQRVVPGGGLVTAKSRDGEPRRALLVTAVVVLAGLLVRDLNAIAPLISMFFLITYGMINVVVLLEQRLAVVSFRPTLRLPFVVPLLGAIGSVFTMFVVNPTFSLVAVVVVVAVYGVLMRRRMAAPGEDVRSGLFLALAEWAARRSTSLPKGRSRAWKANLLVPVIDVDEVLGNFPLIVDLTRPYGSITLLGIARSGEQPALLPLVDGLADDFMTAGVHTTASVLEAKDPANGMVHAMQTLRNAFLRPNVLFLTPLSGQLTATDLERPLRAARDNGMGVIVGVLHPKSALGRHRVVNLWIRGQPPDWEIESGRRLGNLNLAILVAYVITQRWDAELNLVCVAAVEDREAAQTYMKTLVELTRLPNDARIHVLVGGLTAAVRAGPHADLNIFGLPIDGELSFAREMVAESRAACLLVRDSGDEDALA